MRTKVPIPAFGPESNSATISNHSAGGTRAGPGDVNDVFLDQAGDAGAICRL